MPHFADVSLQDRPRSRKWQKHREIVREYTKVPVNEAQEHRHEQGQIGRSVRSLLQRRATPMGEMLQAEGSSVSKASPTSGKQLVVSQGPLAQSCADRVHHALQAQCTQPDVACNEWALRAQHMSACFCDCTTDCQMLSACECSCERHPSPASWLSPECHSARLQGPSRSPACPWCCHSPLV